MDEAIVIPIVALSTPIVIVPSVLFFRHVAKSREMLHRERMRAIEVGYPQPPTGSMLWPSLAAIAMGGLVPCAAVLFAFLAHREYADSAHAWAFATTIGVAGIVGATVLGSRLIASRREGRVEASPSHSDKPNYDPDFYDTVARRG